jgi:hypothetical protein
MLRKSAEASVIGNSFRVSRFASSPFFSRRAYFVACHGLLCNAAVPPLAKINQTRGCLAKNGYSPASEDHSLSMPELEKWRMP